MGTIEDAVKHLADKIGEPIDIRYSGGKWCIMCSRGNIMAVIPGTIQKHLMDSLQIANVRWDNRSPEKPFM